MKSDKDINNSLSEIKKVLTERKKDNNDQKKNTNFFLLEDLVKKGNPLKNLKKKNENNDVSNNIGESIDAKKNKMHKKPKLKKIKLTKIKNTENKSSSIDNVINKEIKPIIKNWINKNLRVFVKKIVLEEFKVISKSAYKKKSISK